MPYYGDYETVGEPYDQHRARDYDATLWRAGKSGAGEGNPPFSLKLIASHPASSRSGREAGDKLDSDRNLEFVTVFKQVKQAQAAGGRGLAPIHAFGATGEGAWYVTDFFERKSLRALVNRKQQVDGAILRHVVASVVAGCLSLQRVCGRSHGNLKLSNVLLGGRTQPLRNTPLLLADPLPAPAGAQPGGANVFERQDLKALGELLLQLVMGQLYESESDYNYPIKSSVEWDRLGKEGESWRKRCDQLLDPLLSLEQVNLTRLAAEFQPKGGSRNLAVAGGVLAGLALVGAGVWLWQSHKPSPPPDNTNQTTTPHPPPLVKKLPAEPGPNTANAATPANPAVLAKDQGRFDQGDYGFTNEPEFLAQTNQPGLGELFGKAMDAANELDQLRKALAAGDYATITTAQPLAGSTEFKQIQDQAAAEQGVLTNAQAHFDQGNYGFLTSQDFLALTNKPVFGGVLSRAQPEAEALATLAGYQQQTNFQAVISNYQSLNLTKPPFNKIYQWATNLAAVNISKESKELADAFTAARQRYAEGHYADVLTGLDKWAGTPEYVELAGRVKAATNELAQLNTALAAGVYATITEAQPLAGSAEFATILAQAESEQGILTNAQAHFDLGNYGFLTSQDFLALTNKPVFGLLLSRAQPEAAELATLAGYRQQTNFQAVITNYQSLNLNKLPFNEIYQWATNQIAVSTRQIDAFKLAGQKFDAGDYTNVLSGLTEWSQTPEYSDLAGRVSKATDELDQLRKALTAGNYAIITSAQSLAGSAEFKKIQDQAAAEQGVLSRAQANLTAGVLGFTNTADFLQLTNKPAFWTVYQQAMTQGAQKEHDYQAKMQAGNVAYGKSDFATAKTDASDALSLKSGDADATALLDKAQFGLSLQDLKRNLVDDPAAAGQSLEKLVAIKPSDPDVIALQKDLAKLIGLDNKLRDLMKLYQVKAQGKAIDPTRSPLPEYVGAQMGEPAAQDINVLESIKQQYPPDWFNKERNDCYKRLHDRLLSVQ